MKEEMASPCKLCVLPRHVFFFIHEKEIILSRTLAHFLHLALRLRSVNHLVNLSLVSPSLTETGVRSVSQQCESSTSFSLPNYNQLKACSTDRKDVALRRAALRISQTNEDSCTSFCLPRRFLNGSNKLGSVFRAFINS